MATKKKAKAKKVVVNRKFLLDLARFIYDSKNRTFLRLCNGTLQNGPDPTDSARPMHCGLGELYFAMTGRHPDDDGVSEETVVNVAVDLSTLQKRRDGFVKKAKAGIKAIGLPDEMEADMLKMIDQANADFSLHSEEIAFREALDAIPDINDDGCEDGSCDVATYRNRSKRVAEQLRRAATFLRE